MADLKASMMVAASGMSAQAERMRVSAENIANSESLSMAPGGDPYRRKTIHFKAELDKSTGAEKVSVSKIGHDQSPFKLKYEPMHPAADGAGYVKYPNVNRLIESQDLKEAQRAYEANVGAIEVTKAMMNRTLDLLR